MTIELTAEQMAEMKRIVGPYYIKKQIYKNGEEYGMPIYFEGLPASVMNELISKDLADPMDTQNSSPTIDFFMEFCFEHPDYKMHGYTILSSDRKDSRISVEGLESNNFLIKDLNDVLEFRYADDFTISIDKKYFFCWYD